MRVKRLGSGLLSRDLSAEERSELGTNRSFVVLAVRNSSPAYFADILPNDVVVAIDGRPSGIDEYIAWTKMLIETSVEATKLTVMRGGERREIEMKIPLDWRGGQEHP